MNRAISARTADLAALLALGAIWGGSFLLMRIAAPALGALPVAGARIAIAALVLLPLALRDARTLSLRDGRWIALVGLVNTALPFALFAWAAEHAPAGVGAIANAATVPCSALIAALFWHERSTTRAALGIAVGFAGIVLLALAKPGGAPTLPAAIAGTVAAFGYGFGANLIKRKLGHLAPRTVAATTLLTAATCIGPFALHAWPATAPTLRVALCLVALGVVCTALAYLLYFRSIARLGAAPGTAVAFWVPLFAMAWGWMALAEVPTPAMLGAAALVLIGIALSRGRSDSGQ